MRPLEKIQLETNMINDEFDRNLMKYHVAYVRKVSLSSVRTAVNRMFYSALECGRATDFNANTLHDIARLFRGESVRIHYNPKTGLLTVL